MLAHQSLGKGIPVVLVHAFPLSSAMWEMEMELLAQQAWVIAPDLPGFGRSARQSKPSIPSMAQEVAALLDKLNVKEPVFIGGLSMGGYVIFEFFRQFPERVRALGLFSTRAGPDTPDGRENRFKTAEKIKQDGLGSFSKAVLLKLLGKTTLETKPAVIRQVTNLMLANPLEGVADALLAMADRRDSTDLLATIKVPTLVVAGDQDSFIPTSEAEALARQIPGARLEVISRVGHLVNLEQPAAFQQVLERFLASVALAR